MAKTAQSSERVVGDPRGEANQPGDHRERQSGLQPRPAQGAAPADKQQTADGQRDAEQHVMPEGHAGEQAQPDPVATGSPFFRPCDPGREQQQQRFDQQQPAVRPCAVAEGDGEQRKDVALTRPARRSRKIAVPRKYIAAA